MLVDDCLLPGCGEGKLVIAYMRKIGWKILAEEYQVLHVREESVEDI